jgi:hypothetical protein
VRTDLSEAEVRTTANCSSNTRFEDSFHLSHAIVLIKNNAFR